MKRTFIFILFSIIFVFLSFAQQENKTIKLNAPDFNRNLMKAFKERASAREFDTTKLSIQDLSDLLWAANGINRPESGKRTTPSAMNSQDIDIYVFLEDGVFLYDFKNSTFESIVTGDKRQIFSGPRKDPIPPVILLLVSDISRFTRGADSLKLNWAALDAGIVSQNISLFCAGNNMLTRPRAGMPLEEIKKLLMLSPTQYPMLNHPVSYKK